MLLPACLWQCCHKHLIKHNYDLVAGPSNIRPRRAQFRGEKLPAYNAPSDDWGHVCARSRLDPLFGLCVCEVRTPRPMGARHTWGRDVREVTQAVFRWFSPTSLGLLAGQDRHISGGAAVRSIHAANVPGLEKVPSPRCLMTSIGNERANAISECEPNNETDHESNFEARRHAAVTPPHEIGFRRTGGNDSPPRRLRAPAVF